MTKWDNQNTIDTKLTSISVNKSFAQGLTTLSSDADGVAAGAAARAAATVATTVKSDHRKNDGKNKGQLAGASWRFEVLEQNACENFLVILNAT